MATATGRLQRYSFDQPDETRKFEEDSGKLDIVSTDSGAIGRLTFQPGWQWSKHVKPIAGTDSCQGSHVGYMVSGRLHVRMDGGEETEFGPGDVQVIDPGHDAWVVGDEPCVMIDWRSVADYAKPK